MGDTHLLHEAVDVAHQVGILRSERNGVGDRVSASTASIDRLVGPFDVVVANIGVRVITDSAAAIGGLVGPGGLLVLAGILDDQVERCVAAYPAFELVDRIDEEGWAVLTFAEASTRT